jgi:hypothetical protein
MDSSFGLSDIDLAEVYEKIQLSMQKMIQLLQINLFTKINLRTLFDPPDETLGDSKLQLSFI